MKILITGKNGQLARELLGRNYDGISFVAMSKDELDITDKRFMDHFFSSMRVDAVINCAAMTNVDGCESEPDSAFIINSLGPRYLAECAEKYSFTLVHISTDYVFDGNEKNPYKETHKCMPASIYGKTKLLGEEFVVKNCNRHLIIRTSWLYSIYQNNFIKTIIRKLNTNESIYVADDLYGSPTYAGNLSDRIIKLILTKNYGIYHYADSGFCSKYELAKLTANILNSKCTVMPCKISEYPCVAARPHFSPLDSSLTEITTRVKSPNWKESLEHFLLHIYNEQSSSLI